MYGGNSFGSIPYGSNRGSYQVNTSTLNDTATLSETIVKATTRAISDTGTITETFFDHVQARGLEFIDNIGLTEVLQKASTRILSDTGTLSEVLSTIRNQFRVLTDNFSGLVDTLTSIRSRFFTFLDTATLSEVLERIRGILLSETATLTEVLTTSYGRFITLTDNFSGLTDSITRAITRNFSELGTLSDTIRKYLNGLLINIWTKVVKTVASFSMTAKPTATYTKTAKPTVTGIWTKVDKPE